jgi:hypothetical protein
LVTPVSLVLFFESYRYGLSIRQYGRKAAREVSQVSSQNDLTLQVARVADPQPTPDDSFAGFQ